MNILVAMCTRERIAQVWSMIQDFDYDTNIMGFPQMERGTKFRTWSIIMLNTVLWVWISQAGMLAFSETWLQNASYLMIYIATCVSVYEYSGIVIILGTRFKHLNKIAVTCSPNQNGWSRLPKIESKVQSSKSHQFYSHGKKNLLFSKFNYKLNFKKNFKNLLTN